ncbi:MAG: hypothetical protein MZV63_15980 [Marinilabiliales bacterium]|nr:hypothetical protein [Marinilabiliales bacterium]
MGVLRGAFHLLRLVQTRQADRAAGHGRAAAHGAAAAEPLGQPRRHASSAATPGASLWDWAELPGPRRPALHATTRARTRRSASTAPCSTTSTRTPRVLHAGVPREGGRPGRRLPALRHPRATSRRNFAAPIELGRPARRPIPLDPAVAALVAATRPTRSTASSRTSAASSSRPTARASPGRRTTAARHADGANVLADARGAARRRRDVAGLRLRRRGRPATASSSAYLEFAPLDGALPRRTCSCR